MVTHGAVCFIGHPCICIRNRAFASARDRRDANPPRKLDFPDSGGRPFSTVNLDTIQTFVRRIIYKNARIGRVRETNVPYAPFGKAQSAFSRAAHSTGGPIGQGTNPFGG